MATRIRLQRHGRKDYPFYPIVIAVAGHHEMVDLLKGLVRITQTLILLQ